MGNNQGTDQQLTDVQLQAIEQQLWAPMQSEGEFFSPKVFAILDGARDKRIEPLLQRGELEQACLYKGKMSYAMKRAAPHIVVLRRGHPQTQEILRLGWGKAWGIFLVCPPVTKLATVSNNCRRLTKVTSPEGKNLLFRFYDPRVIRLLLPVFSPQELHRLMGHAVSLVMEADDQLHWQEYTRNPDQTLLSFKQADTTTQTHVKSQSQVQSQVQSQSSAQASVKTHNNTHPVRTVHNGLNHSATQTGFFKLTDVHMLALQKQYAREEFERIKEYYLECYLEGSSNALTSKLPVGKNLVSLEAFMRLCVNKASEFDIKQRTQILNFINLNQQYGWMFWATQQYAWAKDLLMADRPEEEKIASLNKKLSKILMDKLWS